MELYEVDHELRSLFLTDLYLRLNCSISSESKKVCLKYLCDSFIPKSVNMWSTNILVILSVGVAEFSQDNLWTAEP